MTVENEGGAPSDDLHKEGSTGSSQGRAGSREVRNEEPDANLDVGIPPRNGNSQTLNGGAERKVPGHNPGGEIQPDISLRDFLGGKNSSDEFEVESTESTPKGTKSKAGKEKLTPRRDGINPSQDSAGEIGSWSRRDLLGSRRQSGDSAGEPASGGSTPSRGRRMKHSKVSGSNTGSPLRPGSPLVETLVSPVKVFVNQGTFSRLREEKEEMSRQTPSPKELPLKEGITLPLIGEVKWQSLQKAARIWLSNPKNLALLIWLIAVTVSGAILFMVMVGMLNGVLPKKSDRNTWFEVSNQIINALFTLMVLYVHPMRILHLVWLIRWQPKDILKLRLAYCKDGMRKPNEWSHMVVVVFLLHLNCFAQYALCGLNWGYRRANRPAIGVGITLATSFGAAAAAGMYNNLSPLGKDFAVEDDEVAERLGDIEVAEEMDRIEKGEAHIGSHPVLLALHNKKYKLLEKRMSFASKEGRHVVNPEWEGNLFDCCEEPTISAVTTACFACVLGWNLDRMGFGNRYVHIVTFLLLCAAPYLVFDLAAINVNNRYVRTSLGVTGIVLSVFGLLYGGFWRIKMRERFKLPAQRWCCGQPNMTDCIMWLFCAPCALCQEVRTAEAHDIRDDKFYVRSHHAREDSSGNSLDPVLESDISLMRVPSSSIQPLPSSNMEKISDSALPVEEMPQDLTMLFPPPRQSVNPFEDDVGAHQVVYKVSPPRAPDPYLDAHDVH